MLFNSLDFYCLLALTFVLYWSSRSIRIRQLVLLVASLFFYAYFDPRLLPVLLFSVSVTYLLTLLGRRNPLYFSLSIALNLLLLGFFKYTNFVTTNVVALFGVETVPSFSIALPLGISFFVFQSVSYSLDVKRKIAPAESDLLTFALFISFFPQLIAGPICRSDDLMRQLKTVQPWRNVAVAQGALMLSIGLLMKAGIADNLAPLVEASFSSESDASVVGGVVAFSLQILYDFWGYSTMALGAAWMFGIMLPVNFNLPYLAGSIREFWRRWHITLSFWLRDYLYKALGGNRRSTARTGANLFLVMLIGGLWHGAAWTFVIWGAIHGLALLIERFVLHWTGGVSLPRGVDLLWRVLGWAVTMYVVMIAWIFFRAPGLPRAMELLRDFLAETLFLLCSLSLPDFGDFGVYVGAGIILMTPFHHLIAMGRNLMLYTDGGARHVRMSVPPAPTWDTRVFGFSLALGNLQKVILAFWLTVLAVVLTAPDTVPFIYFQF